MYGYQRIRNIIAAGCIFCSPLNPFFIYLVSRVVSVKTHTTEQSMAMRIRTLVKGRPDLADLLVRQVHGMPKRVFGSTDLSAEQFLEIYIEEATYLFDLVRPYLRPGIRILEVGGGMGLFHVMVQAEGADIISLEPSVAGFSIFRDFGLSMLTELTGQPERFLNACVENTNLPDDHFDMVVSNNVLEHVADPVRALQEMYRVLSYGGMLLHSCPNYLFPYEPHYKVPVIPCAVRFSGKMLWREFQADSLWQSLNSINAFGVWRIVRQLPGAKLAFRRTMAAILVRLAKGGPLAERHGAFTRLALAKPVRILLEALPSPLLTPMVFEITKSESLQLQPLQSGVVSGESISQSFREH